MASTGSHTKPEKMGSEEEEGTKLMQEDRRACYPGVKTGSNAPERWGNSESSLRLCLTESHGRFSVNLTSNSRGWRGTHKVGGGPAETRRQRKCRWHL